MLYFLTVFPLYLFLVDCKFSTTDSSRC